MSASILQIRLSLKGRPIRSYSFSDDVITVGRDPAADVHLDNSGVSRRHALFKRVPDGFVIVDLNSANGTYVNDQRVTKTTVDEGDVVRIGKFSLWVNFKEDRREMNAAVDAQAAAAIDGTTVLSTDQLARMMTQIKKSEESQPEFRVIETRRTPQGGVVPLPQLDAQPEGEVRPRTTAVILGAFLIGASVAGAVLWIMLSR